MEGNRVDTKLLLFTLVLVLITLLLLNYFFIGNRVDGIWNYDEITTATDVMYSGTKVTDRETYYTLESIVNQYMESYVEKEDEKTNYKEYYNYLTENYKKHLGRRKYIEVAEKFLKKFYVNIDSDYEYMNTNRIVKNIYEFDNNIYLCELRSNTTNEMGYIAFQVNDSQLAFNIVYIE